MKLLGCLWLLCGYSGTLVVVKASGGYQGGYQCYVVAKWLPECFGGFWGVARWLLGCLVFAIRLLWCFVVAMWSLECISVC